MTRLYASELLKLKTLRGTWGFVLVAVGLAALFTAGNIGGMTEEARLEPRYQFRLVLDMAFSTGILSLLLGIVLVTNEFRHGTIARTLLAVPRRWRLIATKLATGATTGIGLELLALGTTLAMTAIWLNGAAACRSKVGILPTAPHARSWPSCSRGCSAPPSGVRCTPRSARSSAPSCGCSWWNLSAGCSSAAARAGTGSRATCPRPPIGGIIDSEDEGLPFAGSVGMTIAWVAVLTVLALVRTGRRDIT